MLLSGSDHYLTEDADMIDEDHRRQPAAFTMLKGREDAELQPHVLTAAFCLH
jgi:hypothetical protein